MGIVTLDDGTGSIEAVCYSDAWDQYRDIFVKDEIVIVTGRSRWDEKKETHLLLHRLCGKPSGIPHKETRRTAYRGERRAGSQGDREDCGAF